MISVLKNIIRRGLKLGINEPDIPGWFSLVEMNFVYNSVVQANAVDCLEIGSYMGRSAYAICLALKKLGGKRRLVCVDTFASPVEKEYYERDFMVNMMNSFPAVREEYSNYKQYPTTHHCFNLTMDRYPFMKDFVEVRVSDSKTLDLSIEMFDFVFIDGDHTYEGVKSDFLKVRPFMRNGSIICFHDNSDDFPGVKQFISEVSGMYKDSMVLVGSAESAVSFRIERSRNHPALH